MVRCMFPGTKPIRNGIVRRQRLRWGIPFLAVLLPVALLAAYSFRVASQSVRELVEESNFASGNNLSELVVQDIFGGVSVAHAVASIPGTIAAQEQGDEIALKTRLKAMVVSYPQWIRAFVMTKDGIVGAEYPELLGAYTSDLSGEAWFQELRSTERPTISGAYKRGPLDEYPVIAIAAPIFSDDAREFLGALVFEYSAGKISEWLQGTKLPGDGYLLVVDHFGTLVAHGKYAPQEGMEHRYGDVSQVKEAIAGRLQSDEYDDPVSGERMIATFLPISVGRNTWVTVAQQPKDIAYAQLNRLKVSITIAGVIMTLFTLMMVGTIANMSSSILKLNQKLREIASIVSSSNDAIIGLAPDGTITSWNTSAEKMYGFAEAEMKGKNFLLLVPDDKDVDVQKLIEKISAGEEVDHFDSEHLKKDGTCVPVSINLSPVKDEKGRTIGASVISRDITERKQIEQMKSDFISFVSHQLKAPVTAMKWIIESIFDGDYGEVPGALKEPLKELDSVNANNHHLISDILNVSRIERGVIKMDCADVEMRDIAERAARDYHVVAEKAGLTLMTEGAGVSILVHADLEKTAESVSNAISNAIKHTPQGGKVKLVLRHDDAFGYIDVADTGEGMSEEMLQKLFTRTQVLGKNTSPDRSSGLGLFIARNFMQLQGGDITVTSKLKEGSTFTYKLPLAKPHLS